MKKFKMQLVWHNCETCPPEEDYNECLIYTNGANIYHCEYFKEAGFPIKSEFLHDFWWADLHTTVSEFKKPDPTHTTKVHMLPVCDCGYVVNGLEVINQYGDVFNEEYPVFSPRLCPKCGRLIESVDISNEFFEVFDYDEYE